MGPRQQHKGGKQCLGNVDLPRISTVVCGPWTLETQRTLSFPSSTNLQVTPKQKNFTKSLQLSLQFKTFFPLTSSWYEWQLSGRSVSVPD